jgi:hypothetical protein
MGTYWLVIYLTTWQHVFGTYGSLAECQGAGLEATGQQCSTEAPAWSPLRSEALRCTCVPFPAPKNDTPHPH